MVMTMPLLVGSHDEYQKTADWLMSRTKHRPQVAIICGSGLGMLAETLKCQDSFAYSDIPGFSQSTGDHTHLYSHLTPSVINRCSGPTEVLPLCEINMCDTEIKTKNKICR